MGNLQHLNFTNIKVSYWLVPVTGSVDGTYRWPVGQTHEIQCVLMNCQTYSEP